MLKILLLMPEKKWRTIDKRVKDLQSYLSRKDRLGSIYGEVVIEYKNIKLPQIEMQSNGVPKESFIRSITEDYREGYQAVGIIFPYDRSHKYAGMYYPNTDKTDHKLDFYVESNERSKDAGELMFERFVEHEVAGHGVSLDLGLALNHTNNKYVKGQDNTHFFFYDGDKDQYYKEINELWKAKASTWVTVLKASIELAKQLLGKKKL